MNIGQAANRSGLPAKTIRYYEEIGLVRPAMRAENGYRDYGEADVHRLRFLKRAREHGFSVAECRDLLALWSDHGRASADVKAIAESRIADIDRRIDALRDMRAALAHLVEGCHGDARPHCPILADLAGEDRG